ncbi:MAG: hypothetical protein ABR976_10095 [Terracidiphilus sp.]|jgi:hypothetical protein
MKTPARIAAWLLPLVLAGCTHNTTQVQPLAPPIVDTPLPQPSTAPKDLPPPVVTVPAQPAPDTTTANTEPPPEPKPPAKHKKPATAPPAQVASNESSGVSAIGQLSSGAPSDLREQTSNSIVATERGLNGITRALSDQEQKTAAQIREFLKQAREALTTNDVDGAHTLAVKAKVLLSELTQ